MKTKTIIPLIAILALALVLGACGRDKATPTPEPTATQPPAQAEPTAVPTEPPAETPTASPAETETEETEGGATEEMTASPAAEESSLTEEEAAAATKAIRETLQQVVDPTLESVPNAFGPAPGAVIRVDAPGFQFLEAAGLASVEKGTPVQVDDRFEIGSNTKMFTAVLLMQLDEEGVLSIDDPLSKWLPDWAEQIPNGDQMTLRQLATHTSGIWDYADPLIGAGQGDDEAMRRGYTPEELVQYAIDNGTPDFAPGEEGKWLYSNTGYILLGMVLEAATGQTYADLLQERILDPLGMTETSFPNDVPEAGSIIDGYDFYPGGKNTTEWNPSQGWAAGGIISTAEDLTTFLRALANGQLFQDPQTLQRMGDFVRNDTITFGLAAKGYGIGLIEFDDGVWGHGGQTLGFESELMFVPGTDVTLVGLTNAAYGPVQLIQGLTPVLQQLAGIGPAPAEGEMAPPAEPVTGTAGISETGAITATGGMDNPASEAANKAADLPQYFVQDPCFIDLSAAGYEGEYQCGYVVVSADHRVGGDPVLRLGVLRFPPTGDNPEPDPLVMLQGGPGGSMIALAADAVQSDWFQEVNKTREIILMDQRGTQYTDLPLICPGYATARVQAMLDNQYREEVVSLESQALLNCAQGAVDQGIDIEVFNSLQNAADIKDLRDALGYSQINLYGVSYGTILAQHILREYPKMLRSVTLDGIFPLSINFGDDMGAIKGKAYEDFVAACAADEACNQAYPDLGEKLAGFYDALEASPVPITLTDNATGQTVDAPMDGDLMATVLMNSIYRTSYYDDLLAGLKAAGEGDFTFFVQNVPRALTLDGLAVLMHFTTICAEDADFTMEDVGVEDAPPLLQGYVEMNSAIYLAVCDALNLPTLDDVVNEPVESDLPVLALSGQLDPATPVVWLDQVLPGLSNAYSFVNPAGAHGQLPFGRDDECIASIFSSFLDDPASEPDANCLEEEQIQFLPAE